MTADHKCTYMCLVVTFKKKLKESLPLNGSTKYPCCFTLAPALNIKILSKLEIIPTQHFRDTNKNCFFELTN